MQIRKNGVYDRAEIIKEITAALGVRVSDYLDKTTKTCLNCYHFEEKSELCALVKARPPARIIAQGCEYHTDEIPF